MQEALMREAISLALASAQKGGGPFGALVVQNGLVVGQGTNLVTTSHDPTAHAEIVAIRQASQILASFRLQGCELYATCEPCPMCLAAIYWARIDRVYYAATRADAAAAGFDDALIYQEMALPAARRQLPMNQVVPGDTLAPFEAWAKSPNKVPY